MSPMNASANSPTEQESDASPVPLDIPPLQKKQQHNVDPAGSATNSFLDIEAMVAGDDKEEEEPDKDSLNFFVNDQDLNEANGSHACSNLEMEIARVPSGSTTKPQEPQVPPKSPHVLASLPPQEGDWGLWEVPVTLLAMQVHGEK
ncbi:hypothetical protein P691DRAFT_769495 [Macrolepiota fuliginosa MF-IS2]|uniref:Uncharacterized protein n=1 Tax=Macrolepiota fuliginosa MF-IS2 TaxID=1400762 RepID=A0A9P5WVS2_9AGAR|nr:hypothetical protein P691DRAFT_769495 [Macrolepiota fuliginosa MF-IS2]